MKGIEALAGEGVVGRVERGEPMGWRRGGEELVRPQGLPHCTAGGKGGGPGGCPKPEALGWSSDCFGPHPRNTATKMKTRPLWSTARPTSPTR